MGADMAGTRGRLGPDDNDFLLNDWRPPEQKKPKNRRRGPDFWVQVLTYVSIGGWALFLVTLAVLDAARPETETFFHRLMETAPPQGWNQSLKHTVYGLVALCQGVSLWGIWANRKRMRRKTDKVRWSIVGLALASLGLAAVLLKINS